MAPACCSNWLIFLRSGICSCYNAESNDISQYIVFCSALFFSLGQNLSSPSNHIISVPGPQLNFVFFSFEGDSIGQIQFAQLRPESSLTLSLWLRLFWNALPLQHSVSAKPFTWFTQIERSVSLTHFDTRRMCSHMHTRTQNPTAEISEKSLSNSFHVRQTHIFPKCLTLQHNLFATNWKIGKCLPT